MLTGVIISPETDITLQLTAGLTELRQVRIVGTFNRYPTAEELIRFVQTSGPAIVFLSTQDATQAVALALAVDRSGTGTQVVPVNRTCDPQVLMEIMRAGIREFLSLPLDPVKLSESVARITEVLLRKPLAFTSTEAVFSFLPAKPGGGTSTVALNMASAIARVSEERTLIADFDLNLGMISFLLKITNGHSILDAVENTDNLDESVWNNLVVKRGTLDVLSSGRLNPGNTLEPSDVAKVLHFARRAYTNICIDLSGNMEPYSIELLRQSKEIFLVCTAEIPSLHLARAKTEFLRAAGLEDRMSILLNRCENRSAFSVQDVEKLLGAKVRFSLPNDPKRVGNAMDAGTCVDPNTDLGRQFDTLAASLAGSKRTPKPAAPRRFVEYFAITPATFALEKRR